MSNELKCLHGLNPSQFCGMCVDGPGNIPTSKPSLSEDQLKRLAFLRLSNAEKMKHCVFCGEEFGPNEAGHINCGGKLLDVKLPALSEDGTAIKLSGDKRIDCKLHGVKYGYCEECAFPKVLTDVPAEGIATKVTACVCGVAKSYHYHPSDNPSALRDGKCSGYKPRYPVEPSAPVVHIASPTERGYPQAEVCRCSHQLMNHCPDGCVMCSCLKFEASQPAPVVVPDGATLIQQERRRQVESEKWTPEHDDAHTAGEMLGAATSYLQEGWAQIFEDAAPPSVNGHGEWPWDMKWWKPSPDPIRNLVKAGALIAAEIDRLQRANGVTAQPAPLPSDDDDNFTAAARFAGITFSQGCQFHLMMQHLLGNGPAPGFLKTEPAALPSDQKETFEEWWIRSASKIVRAGMVSARGACYEGAKAAWNAAKGGTN